MVTKELRITVENRPGVLARIGAALASEGINIRGVVAFGERAVLRMVVSDAEKAKGALAKKDITSEVHDVITVRMPDKPGALGTLAKKLSDAGLNIDYTYGTADGGESLLVIGVDDPAKAEKIIGGM
jgi:hypothetical protein